MRWKNSRMVTGAIYRARLSLNRVKTAAILALAGLAPQSVAWWVAVTEDLILQAKDLDVRYGPFRALFDVSLDMPKGSMVALLGPNGAGKSTLGRALSGLIPVASGRIVLEG